MKEFIKQISTIDLEYAPEKATLSSIKRASSVHITRGGECIELLQFLKAETVEECVNIAFLSTLKEKGE